MNKLILGDNLEMLKKIKDESVDLVYIDPPFFSNRNYEVVFGDEAETRSFEDRWEGGMSVYVDWMKERAEELYRVLKPTGSFYLHCDWHASHYLKIMIDEVFGYNNFRNEIIWSYNTSGKSKKHFGRKHDIIYFYSKSKEYNFTEQRVKDTGKNVSRYNKTDSAGNKYYMRSGKYKVIYRGDVPLTDTWTDLPAITNNAKERLGYPTQKPEALLKRIIEASSNKGDIVLDAFCGCGTTIAVAQQLDRKWIGIDISPTAIKLMEKRLVKLGAVKDKTFMTVNTPTTVDDLRIFKPFEFQNWVVEKMGARNSKKKSGDMGVDGYFVGDLLREKAGIQVKQSDSIGRNVIDNFVAALQRADYKKGYIVALSFGKGIKEEAIKVKKRGLDIKLIEVADLLVNKKNLL